jgi:pimeloyl-ACP methyl ester carboxylesterase
MHPSLVEKFASLPAGPFAGAAERKTLPTSRADVAVRMSAGEGLPILLVHGIGGSSDDFDTLFGLAFAHDHRLIAVDLPGHGRSGEASDHDTAYTVEGYAESLLETLERLGIDNVFVIDRSENGCIGRELMAIFPGALGLAVVDDATFCETPDASLELPPIYRISSTSDEALEPVIQALELREAALSVAPRLWYGG